jgi:hypothetical protein
MELKADDGRWDVYGRSVDGKVGWGNEYRRGKTFAFVGRLRDARIANH